MRRGPSGIAPARLTVRRANPLPAFLALMGIVIPSDLQLSIAGAKLTAGRIGIVVLLIPAISKLFQRGRHMLLSDFFACATGAWIIGAAAYVDGTASLPSASVEALEFVGGYFVARGLFFGPAALITLIRLLKVLAFMTIVVAMVDTVSGRWIVSDTLASIVHTPPLAPQYRGNLVRAISTFDHPILFGVFCSLVAALLLYSEPSVMRRTLYVGLCLLGCTLSMSSAALMSFSIVLAAYFYDLQMRQYPWRWSALSIGLAMLLLVVLVTSDHPLGWLLSHLTLDPQSGYFRLLIWDAALDRISQAPITGFSFTALNHYILDTTIDTVWLVFSLRFGIPMILFLFLTNVAAFWPSRKDFKNQHEQSYMDDMRPAFTTMIVMFMFTGLTVHFWNYMWCFWGICIGIRASLREWDLPEHRRMEMLRTETAAVGRFASPSFT